MRADVQVVSDHHPSESVVMTRRESSLSRPSSSPPSGATGGGREVRPGGAIFGSPTQRRADCAAAERRRYVVAQADRVRPGSLRHAIDEAIEGSLAARGALPPSVHIHADVAEVIRDQLFRIRALGSRGLTLCLPSLTLAADEHGMLLDPDALVLWAWLEAARHDNVELLLDEVDRGLFMRAPRSLDDVVQQMAPEPDEPDPVVFSEPPPAGEELPALSALPSLDEVPDLFEPTAHLSDAYEPTELDGDDDFEPEELSAAELDGRENEDEDEEEEEEEDDDSFEPASADGADEARAESWSNGLDLAAKMAAALGDPEDVALPASPEELFSPAAANAFEPELVSALAAIATPTGAARPTRSHAPEPPLPAEAASRPAEVVPVRAAAQLESGARLVSLAEWRNFALELDAARGPKPVSAIERLFRTRYVPLLGAAARGEVDATVLHIIDQWRQAFAQSYLDSFSALRVTGRRPPMVLDAPDIAAKIGRLNGARSVKLLLVDSMSFELGERVAHRIRDQHVDRAVCVERTMLWAALPTDTPTQMKLLARGADGLSDPQLGASSEPDVARGRAVSTLRRIRIGQREVMKLDLVEARLQTTGPEYDERMELLADEVVDVLSRYIETLPSRTLLFVFGDHGFSLPAGPNGWATGAAKQGGASPEEVLVSGHAWLVDGMH